MARIRIRHRGKATEEVFLETSRQYIVGRKEDCDIVLKPEKGISREHFKIKFDNNVWSVELISRYGDLLFAGEKKTNIVLSAGVIFSIPPYEFEYDEVSEPQAEVPISHFMEVGAPQPLSAEVFSDRTFVGAVENKAVLKMIDAFNEVKETVSLNLGTHWVAGRDSSCQIHINDPRVSRRQFEIKKSGPQFEILDLGSVNGTLLNNVAVPTHQAMPLKSGDQISVLDNIMLFELHDPQFEGRLSGAMVPSTLFSENASPVSMPTPHAAMPFPSRPHVPQKRRDISSLFAPEHRIKLIIAVLIVMGLGFWIMDDGTETSQKAPVASSGGGAVSGPMVAFNKLKPEQQALVKQSHRLAKSFFMQQKFELAKSELSKIYEFIPEYEDSKEIDRLSDEALSILKKQKEEDRRQQEKVKIEEQMSEKITECKSKINLSITMDDFESCIQPVLQFNPEDLRVREMREKVQSIIESRQLKKVERENYSRSVQQLKKIYQEAEKIKNSGKLLQAIPAFEKVIQSNRADPDNLKMKAKNNINQIRKTIDSQAKAFLTNAEQLYSGQDLKGAINALRSAREIDPQNYEIQEKIEKYVTELKKQMSSLYQEGILEESFGNIVGGDGKQGAIDRWKKIIELDISDGEYYRKAFIKLKKYRVL